MAGGDWAGCALYTVSGGVQIDAEGREYAETAFEAFERMGLKLVVGTL